MATQRVMLYLGYHIEIKSKDYSMTPFAKAHWASKIITIYDPKKQINEAFCTMMIQYLYDEGFIEDRRTDVEIVDSGWDIRQE